MHYMFRNVNDAFREIVGDFETGMVPLIRTESRVGEVLQIPEPVIVTYTDPRERVLFNQARDANPFFHLMESLWMLAGCNDVERMKYYNSKIGEIASDDGITFNGAYGHRWRHFNNAVGDPFDEVDQLDLIIKMLRQTPNSRRMVLQMWSPYLDLFRAEELPGSSKSKDVCCNTNCYFLLNNGRLDMTVCNRSNDLIWGMLGANVVHFSVLHEYVAAGIGKPVGVYNQITNNLHVYTERFAGQKWMGWEKQNESLATGIYANPPKFLVSDFDVFNEELMEFVEDSIGPLNGNAPEATSRWREPFFRGVASPMAHAYHAYKEKHWSTAAYYCSIITSDDWQWAAADWINRRQLLAEAA